MNNSPKVFMSVRITEKSRFGYICMIYNIGLLIDIQLIFGVVINTFKKYLKYFFMCSYLKKRSL